MNFEHLKKNIALVYLIRWALRTFLSKELLKGEILTKEDFLEACEWAYSKVAHERGGVTKGSAKAVKKRDNILSED